MREILDEGITGLVFPDLDSMVVGLPQVLALDRADVRARAVINAAGVWSDSVRAMDEGTNPHSIRPAKGIHITVPWEKVRNDIATIVPVPTPLGRAIGAALAIDAGVTPRAVSSLSLGPAFSDAEIKRTLDNCRLDYVYEPDWQRVQAAEPFAPADVSASLGRVPDWMSLGRPYADSFVYTFQVLAGYLREMPDDAVLILLGDAMMRAHTEATNVTKAAVRIVNTQDIFRGALVHAGLFLAFSLLVAWWTGRGSAARATGERPSAGEWMTAAIAALFVVGLLAGVAAGYFYAVEAAAIETLLAFLDMPISRGCRARFAATSASVPVSAARARKAA